MSIVQNTEYKNNKQPRFHCKYCLYETNKSSNLNNHLNSLHLCTFKTPSFTCAYK